MKKSIFILCILLAGGQSLLAQDVKAPEKSANRAFKVDPFSGFTGKVILGYEQPITNKVSVDADFGWIGNGPFSSGVSKPSGFFLKAGPRFYANPDYYTEDMRRYSDFQGFYFQPTLSYSTFEYEPLELDFDVFEEAELQTQQSVGLLLNMGKQIVFGEMVLLDLHGGLGYGYSKYEERVKNFSHFGNQFIANIGFSVGILTK